METKIKCVECGYEFVISEENKKWYEEKGYAIPKRCLRCRRARRNERRNAGEHNESTKV